MIDFLELHKAIQKNFYLVCITAILGFLRKISTNLQSDQELVQSFKKTGDLNTLATLFERYMDLLYGVCLKYLKDEELSKDAVMQVFEGLGEKVKKHEISNFKSWLHTVAKNHCLMQLRTPRNLKTTEFDGERMQFEEDSHLDEVIAKEQQLSQMERCLETLSEEQKLTVTKFYLENKSYHDIAAETGIEWNKIRSFIQNGRRNLKICMEKNAGAEQPINKSHE